MGVLLRDYELVVIVSPEVSEENLPSALQKVEQLISAKGGSITSVDHWGRRQLAYPIEKFTDGTYVLNKVKLDPAATKQLEADLLLSDEIIRHLLIVVDL